MKKMIRTLLMAAAVATLTLSAQARPSNDIPFNVPDGGATAGLLALGIGAIAVMRRRNGK